MKFTSCKHWFKHIACIHGTICFSGTYNCMKLINKEYNLTFAFLYFLKNRLKSFLKLTSVFCTCDECPHIKCKYFFIFKLSRHITSYYTLCKPLNCRCFTDARLTDKYRIIFIFSRKNTDDISNLTISADNRIHFSFLCSFYKVGSVFFKCIISCFRIITCHTLVSSHL